MVHCRGALTRPKVAVIVQVASVGDMRESALSSQPLHLREQLVLAVEAALRIIALVVRVGELVGRKRLYRDRVLLREGPRRHKLCAWQ